MGCAGHVARMGDAKITTFCIKVLKERNHLDHLDIDWRMLLK